MGPVHCSETSVKDYDSKLHNNPEDRRSQFLMWHDSEAEAPTTDLQNAKSVKTCTMRTLYTSGTLRTVTREMAV
jgi:hypothetical protein